MNIFSAVIFFLVNRIVYCEINFTDPRLKQLPSIFHIDDNEKCNKEGKTFCTVSIVLKPIDIQNNSTVWNIIEDTINDSKLYNHNELYHAICVNDICPINENNLDLKKHITDCYNVKYEHLGLRTEVTELSCKNDENIYSTRFIDKIILVLAITYISFILLETYWDFRGDSKCIIKAGKDGKRIFSILTNWKRMCSFPNTEEFRKLKFIQGIRFYNTLLIILCHTVCSYLGGYISNTEYFESIPTSEVKRFMVTLFLFLVQTFFLLSAFLLSYHMCQTMDNYTGSKKKYVFLSFLNRYLRIFPPLFVMILLTYSIWIFKYFTGPLRKVFSDKEFTRCQENWWTNLLFINNHYNGTEMCYLISWYLSADTQLYLVSLAILCIIWTYRHKTKTVLSIGVLTGIILPSWITYYHGYDVIYRFVPEKTKLDNFRSTELITIYASTLVNMASYLIGLCLGYYYYYVEKNKNWKKSYNSMGMLIFMTVPISIIYITSFEYSPVITALLSGVVRPCYALGIGIGILVMSQQKTGIIKRIFEWKPVVFIGNFTYTIYLVQYGTIFFRTATVKEPYFVSDYVFFTSFLRDVICTIFCGFLMHILVEIPALQLQKLYVPQIRNKKPDSKKL